MKMPRSLLLADLLAVTNRLMLDLTGPSLREMQGQ